MKSTGKVFCRKSGDSTETILDTRSLHDPLKNVTKILVSNDEYKVAYLVAGEDQEQGDLYVRNISGFFKSEFKIPSVFNFYWSPDDKHILFTQLDSKLHSSNVWAVDVGSREKKLLYSEKEPDMFADVTISKDKKSNIISLNSKSKSECYLVDSNLNLRLIKKRQDGAVYFADVCNDSVFLLIKDNRHRIQEFPLSELPIKDGAATIFTADDKSVIMDLELFKTLKILTLIRNGLPELVTEKGEPIPLPERICYLTSVPNTDKEATVFKFKYSSPLTIEAHCEYNFKSKDTLIKDISSPFNTNPSEFIIENRLVQSSDVEIPVTIMHLKHLERNSNNPCLIYTYGAYGESSNYHFRPHHLQLLKMGFVIAITHVRGGSGVGVTWHASGNGKDKMNTFKDIYSTAKYLIAQKYTSPSLLAGEGNSAGGLAFAAAANIYPDLFKALILRSPFLDPLSSMLDELNPLTVSERGEWGDPISSVDDFKHIESYSPYENLIKFDTAILLSAGITDQRVHISQCLKYVAKARELENDCLLNVHRYGHFAGQRTIFRDYAIEIAFLLDKLKIDI
ncbi:hypothetical protein HDV01_002819 [Terramyces sp. JEL0728]|nr:hypothetical protein HDV01_002819 [Terramyces sp. JEL0728]